ncbi:hypothetical protein B0T13DRAFT_238813 [Neurospora crassa]|nr:hypothetical protein B0T13DRAFT_238813 [Neurospora crassa]
MSILAARAAWVPTISAIDLGTPRRGKKCTQPRRAGQQLQTVLDLGIPRRSNCCQAFPLLIDLHKRERDVGNQQQPPPPSPLRDADCDLASLRAIRIELNSKFLSYLFAPRSYLAGNYDVPTAAPTSSYILASSPHMLHTLQLSLA